MNVMLGGNRFDEVEIPLLWGTRAVLQDNDGRISVINLGRSEASVEVLWNRPAPNVEYLPIVGGFEILDDQGPAYSFQVEERTLTSKTGDLPECEIREDAIRVGGSFFQANLVSGFQAGLVVNEQGIGMGAPLPAALAELVV